MTRAQKASDATLDEILASIRRIIAEEPEGTRPLASPKPKLPTADVASEPGLEMTPKPSATSPAGEPRGEAVAASLSSLRPGGVRPPPATAPTIEPKPTPMLGDDLLDLVADDAGPGRADNPAKTEAPALDPAFGRLADALGGNRRAMPVPPAPVIAPAGRPAAAPRPQASATPPQAARPVDDLSDLLDDGAAAETPSPANGSDAAAAAPASVTSAATAARQIETPSPAEATPPMRREAESGRTIPRRTIDLGAIVPARDEAIPAVRPAAKSEPAPAPSLMTPSPGAPAVPADLSGTLPRPSSQSRAMDKMLSARIASATVKAPPPEPEAKGPVVIAAMPAPAPAAVDSPDAAAGNGVSTDEADAANLVADAESAFDLLAAGLAGSATAAAAPEPMPGPAPAPAPAPIAAVAAAIAVPPPVEAPASALSRRPAVSTAEPELPPSPPAPAAVAATAPAAEPLSAAPVPAAAAPAAPGSPSVAMTVAPAPQAPAAVALPPVVGVRTIEDMVAELLRPMLREWLAENMPRMVEKALRIELAEGLKTVNHTPVAPPRKVGEK